MRISHMIRHATAALVIATAAAVAQAAPRSMEPVKTEHTDVKTVVKETDIEIKTSRGLIVMSVNRTSQIKIVTILGRTVCSDTVSPGTYELHLAHGVYIVKVGELTFKIAV